jgi:hypothetical protein
MPDLEGDDLKKLHEHLEKLVEELGVEEVKRMLVADRFPTGHYLPIAKWLRKKEASKASPEGAAPVEAPAEKSHDDAADDAEAERPDAAGVARVKKSRRRSASRKPAERPVSDWVIKAMTKMVEKDGPNVLDLSVKNMRRRLQEARPDRDAPSDEVIHDARLEVPDRLKSVSDR